MDLTLGQPRSTHLAAVCQFVLTLSEGAAVPRCIGSLQLFFSLLGSCSGQCRAIKGHFLLFQLWCWGFHISLCFWLRTCHYLPEDSCSLWISWRIMPFLAASAFRKGGSKLLCAESVFFIFCFLEGTDNRTQNLVLSRQILCCWAVSPTPEDVFLSLIFILMSESFRINLRPV